MARSLWERLGGYSLQERFSGDTDFVFRASFAAPIVNIPYHTYFRRIHGGSLTGSPITGLTSPRRRSLLEELKARHFLNLTKPEPDLTPHTTAEPTHLTHLTGPKLNT